MSATNITAAEAEALRTTTPPAGDLPRIEHQPSREALDALASQVARLADLGYEGQVAYANWDAQIVHIHDRSAGQWMDPAWKAADRRLLMGQVVIKAGASPMYVHHQMHPGRAPDAPGDIPLVALRDPSLVERDKHRLRAWEDGLSQREAEIERLRTEVRHKARHAAAMDTKPTMPGIRNRSLEEHKGQLRGAAQGAILRLNRAEIDLEIYKQTRPQAGR